MARGYEDFFRGNFIKFYNFYYTTNAKTVNTTSMTLTHRNCFLIKIQNITYTQSNARHSHSFFAINYINCVSFCEWIERFGMTVVCEK